MQSDLICRRIADSIAVKNQILNDVAFIQKIEEAANLCVASLRMGGKILFCGNGGSASDAQHLSAELSGRYYKDRKALAAEALHVNTSYLTAVANDFGYDCIYSRLLEGIGKPEDVLVALSTSGNSRNIVLAAETARNLPMKVIALTGAKDSQLKLSADLCFQVPSVDTPRVQESHIMIGHIMCELIEATLF